MTNATFRPQISSGWYAASDWNGQLPSTTPTPAGSGRGSKPSSASAAVGSTGGGPGAGSVGWGAPDVPDAPDAPDASSPPMVRPSSSARAQAAATASSGRVGDRVGEDPTDQLVLPGRHGED